MRQFAPLIGLLALFIVLQWKVNAQQCGSTCSCLTCTQYRVPFDDLGVDPNCTMYISCEFGQRYNRSCATGRYFNPATLNCELDYDGCINYNQPVCDPNKPRYLIRLSTECSMYFTCTYGTLYGPIACPNPGDWFNNATETCEAPWSADCDNPSTAYPSPTPISSTFEIPTTTYQTTTSDQSGSTSDPSTTVVPTCPTTAFPYDPSTTDPPDSTTTEAPDEPTTDATDPGTPSSSPVTEETSTPEIDQCDQPGIVLKRFANDPMECGQFYLCVNGVSQGKLYGCGEGHKVVVNGNAGTCEEDPDCFPSDFLFNDHSVS